VEEQVAICLHVVGHNHRFRVILQRRGGGAGAVSVVMVTDGSLRLSTVEVRLQLSVGWLGWQNVERQEKSLF
jgi:hypothetical protein